MLLRSTLICACLFLAAPGPSDARQLPYAVVDSGQEIFYDNRDEIAETSPGEAFYGQDAQFPGNRPAYTGNGDGTVTDTVTGLMWLASPDLNGDGEINVDDKMTHADAAANADGFEFAGYSDWRLPSVKELYSLILFSGKDCSGWSGTDTSVLVPFIDTGYFAFGYGDTEAGERVIDAQFATSTIYAGLTMHGAETMFGVNFADGRIKGYPKDAMHGQDQGKLFYVLYVRGNPDYGANDFIDNGDGTVTDAATGLMWAQEDNGEAVSWEEALAWAERMNGESYLGCSDWRVPSVKEFQSIVDYSHSPSETGSPAIDPLFSCSVITDEGGGENWPFYWSGTTHATMVDGGYAAYVAFGEALGWMRDFGGNYSLLDVHGAGAQRSDPKTGDPADYPYGHGPQGDVIRIYNHVRLVRDAEIGPTGVGGGESDAPVEFAVLENYPNPFNAGTVIRYELLSPATVSLSLFNIAGQEIRFFGRSFKPAGAHEVLWDGTDDSGRDVGSGTYLVTLAGGGTVSTSRMLLLR